MDILVSCGSLIAPLVLVVGGVWRALQWLDGPDSAKGKLRKRAAWLEVAAEFDQLGDHERADGFRKTGNRALAQWVARGDLRGEWKWRAVLSVVTVELAVVSGIALLVAVFAPPGPKEWAAFLGCLGLLLVSALGLVWLGIEQFGFGPAAKRAADAYAARLECGEMGGESRRTDSGAHEATEADGPAPTAESEVSESLRGAHAPTRRVRGLDRSA